MLSGNKDGHVWFLIPCTWCAKGGKIFHLATFDDVELDTWYQGTIKHSDKPGFQPSFKIVQKVTESGEIIYDEPDNPFEDDRLPHASYTTEQIYNTIQNIKNNSILCQSVFKSVCVLNQQNGDIKKTCNDFLIALEKISSKIVEMTTHE